MLPKMLSKSLKKSHSNFYCEKCDYSANRKSDLQKHFKSKKHNATMLSVISDSDTIICGCGKEYKHRSSFYRHKKICKFIVEQESESKIGENTLETESESKPGINTLDQESEPKTGVNTLETEPEIPQFCKPTESVKVINMLRQSITDNKKLQEQLIEMQQEHNNTLQKIIPKIGNTTNTTHNRIINVQMFLHEKCNDAMSIQNFARKLMVTMDDMNGDKSESITNVVLKNLQPLSLTERPFHCTNIRKKEWYVKDEIEGWEEDNGEKIIKNTEVAIQKKWIDEFQKKYPNWGIDEKLKDKFVMIATATSSELPEKLKIKLIKELGSATPLTKNEIVNIN